MDPKQVQEMWPKFDKWAKEAHDAGHDEIAAVVDAIKIQTELMNSRLAAIEALLGALLRK